jgi:HPt (histidine-containing phosphotransfer) domain-containing protein
MILKEDFPRHLEDLRGAAASQDMKAVKVVGHTLKGMLSNLAVTKAAAAAQLEQLAGGASPISRSIPRSASYGDDEPRAAVER